MLLELITGEWYLAVVCHPRGWQFPFIRAADESSPACPIALAQTGGSLCHPYKEALAALCKDKRPDDYVFVGEKTGSCVRGK